MSGGSLRELRMRWRPLSTSEPAAGQTEPSAGDIEDHADVSLPEASQTHTNLQPGHMKKTQENERMTKEAHLSFPFFNQKP